MEDQVHQAVGSHVESRRCLQTAIMPAKTERPELAGADTFTSMHLLPRHSTLITRAFGGSS